MKKKVLKVSTVRVSFFLFEPILSASPVSFLWKETKPAGMMLQQLLESKGPVKCELFVSLWFRRYHLSLQAVGQSWRKAAFLLSIFHMVSILKICYNYRKFNAEVCSLRLLEG